MELLDFTEFEPFNALRQKMGTERLGYFDLYPNRKRGYSQKLLTEFSLRVFFKLYQLYPLRFHANRDSLQQ